jgi:hypothetical protein
MEVQVSWTRGSGTNSRRAIIYFLIALAAICLLIWVARSSEERRGSQA